jgi:hypothetical protein
MLRGVGGDPCRVRAALTRPPGPRDKLFPGHDLGCVQAEARITLEQYELGSAHRLHNSTLILIWRMRPRQPAAQHRRLGAHGEGIQGLFRRGSRALMEQEETQQEGTPSKKDPRRHQD